MNKPGSLVLITVDCLRADHVGFMGYARPTTPFLDSLAGSSTIFDNAIVAGAPTYYSFPALLASRYPLALGRDVIGVAPEEPTLASALNQVGYDTAAFVAGNPYLSGRFGYAEGFQVFRDFVDGPGKSAGPGGEDNHHKHGLLNDRIRRASHKLGLGFLYEELYFRYGQQVAARSPKSLEQLRCYPSADVMVAHAGDWLRQRSGAPVFLWLHLMDPHGPYYPPQESLELMGDSGMTPTRARYLNSYWNRTGLGARRLQRVRREIVSLYDSGIRWVDRQIAGLVEILRNLGLWNDCVFALTADHGEEFLDHGGRMHAPPKATEELVHVPLLLHAPGVAPARIAAPFSLLHLAPTLLDCLGAPLSASFQGRSYWPQLKAGQSWDEGAIVEYVKGCSNPLRKADRARSRVLAVREARHKLILDFATGSDELFDLETDPGELHPLPREGTKVVRRRLLERARAHIVESLRSRDAGARAALVLRDIALECAEA